MIHEDWQICDNDEQAKQACTLCAIQRAVKWRTSLLSVVTWQVDAVLSENMSTVGQATQETRASWQHICMASCNADGTQMQQLVWMQRAISDRVFELACDSSGKGMVQCLHLHGLISKRIHAPAKQQNNKKVLSDRDKSTLMQRVCNTIIQRQA